MKIATNRKINKLTLYTGCTGVSLFVYCVNPFSYTKHVTVDSNFVVFKSLTGSNLIVFKRTIKFRCRFEQACQ